VLWQQFASDMFSFNEDCERLLRENSSSATSVHLRLPRERRPGTDRLGEALRGNTHVEELFLLLPKIEEVEDIALLLQFMQRSASLKTLSLLGGNQATARAEQFLQAAGRSSALTSINLLNSVVPVEIFAAMMRMTSSIEELGLCWDVSFESVHPQAAASIDEQLAAAFTSNRSLKKLTLDLSVSAVFSRSVMLATSKHPSVEELCLSREAREGVDPPPIPDHLGCLFSSCGNNLVNVIFESFDWKDDEFKAIAASLQENKSVKTITLWDCSFDGQSAQDLGSIFQSKQMRRILIVQGTIRFPEGNGDVLADLAKFAEGLSELDLGHCLRENLNDIFNPIISALTESTSGVEKISFGNLAPNHCEALIQSLPAFRTLRTIYFSLDQSSSHLRGRLLSAIHNNSSLTETFIEAPFLDNTFTWKINDRNKKLPPLITSTPESSGESISLWPLMFEACLPTAEGVGPQNALRALNGLGDHVGTCDDSDEGAAIAAVKLPSQKNLNE